MDLKEKLKKEGGEGNEAQTEQNINKQTEKGRILIKTWGEMEKQMNI